MEIIYTQKFVKLFRKLPKQIQDKAIKKEKIFKKDVFSPSLKTHKLSGRLRGFYSFSIAYKYRIIFEFLTKKQVVFHIIGSHSIYE